jgi:hypothetical protein
VITLSWNSVGIYSSRKFETCFVKDKQVKFYLYCTSLLSFHVYSVTTVVIIIGSKRIEIECAGVPKVRKEVLKLTEKLNFSNDNILR